MPPLTARARTRDFAMSRILRILAFSAASGILVVLVFMSAVAFLWNGMVRHWMGGAEYTVRPLWVGGAMVLLTLVLSRMYWVAAKTPAQRIREPGTADWSEPTTHAKAKDRARYEPGATEAEKKIPSGPTGPSGYGQPSGGWDQAKLP